MLRLDNTLAKELLGWRPRWSVATALDWTVDWHRSFASGADMHRVCLDQIRAYADS